jgi:hypothetical protein
VIGRGSGGQLQAERQQSSYFSSASHRGLVLACVCSSAPASGPLCSSISALLTRVLDSSSHRRCGGGCRLTVLWCLVGEISLSCTASHDHTQRDERRKRPRQQSTLDCTHLHLAPRCSLLSVAMLRVPAALARRSSSALSAQRYGAAASARLVTLRCCGATMQLPLSVLRSSRVAGNATHTALSTTQLAVAVQCRDLP